MALKHDSGAAAPPATAAPPPAIEAHELYRFYHTSDEETLALRGVSLRVRAGETVAVVGPSGSGKTTLLACLCGMDEPDGGFVSVMGRRMSRRPEAERTALRAANIGILLQSGNLFDHLSVADNVRLQLSLRLPARSAHSTIDEQLARLGIEHRHGALPAQLSGGEAARAGLAVALAAAPPIVLADEPTAEVDEETERRILAVLDEHKRGGGAAIVATHSAAVARWADRVVHLIDGRVADA